ncbi:MAG TPA: hypothetical protein PKK26_09280, partial [Candidatus Wallbacteria bacterium]|nr:hypothetical protein [Candidatus Wallbacteria bacterium]
MKIRNFRAISFLLPLFACLFSFLPVLTNAAAEPAEEISISTNEVRPVSDFKIAVPAANAGQLIENMEAENSRLVEIDYSQFLKLAEKNNRLISEKCEVEKLKRQLKNRKKALPADCVISRASYRFAKKGENIFCDLNMDISVLNDKNFLTIPVLGGRIAITDARLDDTAPVMMVEPINFTEYKNTSGHQMAGNDYSLILKGKGDHRLCVKFMLAPEKSDATNFFRINTANSPENSVVFLHDERYASVKMEPCVGLRLFTHPGSGNRAMEGHFGVSDSLLISYFTITDEEMKRAENAAKAEVKTGGTEEAAVIGGVSGILKHPDPLSVKKNETRASFKCSVKTIFSFGDETILGKHELNFKVIKGGVARFSLGLAPGMDIDEVLSNNFDRMLVRELKSGSSVEILLKTAAEKDFSITLKTVTKIQDSAREAGLPELQIQDAESERGYIAVCAFSNVKIEISKEPLNLERVDAYEMPEDMRYSTVSPVLYAFKYFRHPYKADMALTRYSDAEALSTLITASSINTVVTPDGTAVSKISIDMKNNGMPFLKMIPAGTCEILESNVNLRPVKTSVDSSSNFRIPIIRSEIKNENVGDFPVRIKTSSDIDKLSSYVGLFKIKMPRVDLPMMSFEWRIFVPDGFVFFDMNGSPGLKQPTPFMVFYQIPVNIVIAVSNVLYSDNFWHFLIFIGMIIFIASFAYASYFGIEKAAAAFANIWDCLYYAGAAIINAVNFAKLGVALIFLWVLAAVCTPQFAAMTEDAKSTKAKQDCDTLAQAAQKYNSLEGGVVRDAFMKELKGKYLTNLDTLKDPWGNRYELDIQRGVVFSKGADGKTGTKDDITVFYADPTALEPDANTGGNDKKASVADARKIAETASRKGVFSVPVNLVKTNTFYLLNKKFVMPDQDIFLNISYMTSGVYMFLCALLMISGALLPYFLGGAIEFDRRFALMVSAVLSIIFVIETVNMYIPQTAKYPQIGLLCGTILLI